MILGYCIPSTLHVCGMREQKKCPTLKTLNSRVSESCRIWLKSECGHLWTRWMLNKAAIKNWFQSTLNWLYSCTPRDATVQNQHVQDLLHMLKHKPTCHYFFTVSDTVVADRDTGLWIWVWDATWKTIANSNPCSVNISFQDREEHLIWKGQAHSKS